MYYEEDSSMSTVEHDIVQSQEQATEQATEQAEQQRLKMEELVARYFQNKEIAKERNEENKLIFEELEALFEESESEELILPLPNGELAVLSPSFREREVLDKDALADEMAVSKDDLKTPFDFSMFTSQGKLTPAMITKYTQTEREMKLRISKRKATTRRRRSKKTLPTE